MQVFLKPKSMRDFQLEGSGLFEPACRELLDIFACEEDRWLKLPRPGDRLRLTKNGGHTWATALTPSLNFTDAVTTTKELDGALVIALGVRAVDGNPFRKKGEVTHTVTLHYCMLLVDGRTGYVECSLRLEDSFEFVPIGS